MATLAEPAPRASLWLGVWRVADPKITLASVASMLVGAALAGFDGPIAWGWLGVTVLGIFFLEAAKNASGEIFDWDSGADQAVSDEDRSPFSGGKRILVDGLVTRRQAWGIAFAFYALGGAAGLALVLAAEPRVLAIGLVGAALAFFYHAPPLKLSYRGLGELAVAAVYGPLICAGTYLVQRHELPARVWLASLPVGLLVGAFLWVNELPDRRADETAGKRTLVVRLGARRAAAAFAWWVAAAFVALAALPLAGLPVGVLVGFIALPHAISAARQLRAATSTREVVPAQAATLLAFVLLAAGMAAGLVGTALAR
jgi:1,4-dihydroxy-2-naphthoate octaprenyltransferase